MNSIGEKLTNDDVDEIFNENCMEHGGMLTYEVFKKMINDIPEEYVPGLD